MATLRDYPDQIDNASLSSFDGLDQGCAPRTENDDGEAHQSQMAWAILTHKTSEDTLFSAFEEIEDVLRGDVLDAVMTLTPVQFERLVVDLLLAMGYGVGALERGQQTQISNDGAIDGIIHEDELGLDAVYIQAKLHGSDKKVGRTDLNAFVGSLTGEGASKGVFVTTSRFTQGARDYIKRVQHRIVLIDGPRLA